MPSAAMRSHSGVSATGWARDRWLSSSAPSGRLNTDSYPRRITPYRLPRTWRGRGPRGEGDISAFLYLPITACWSTRTSLIFQDVGDLPRFSWIRTGQPWHPYTDSADDWLPTHTHAASDGSDSCHV